MKKRKKLNKKQWIVLVLAICCVVFMAGYMVVREYQQRKSVVYSNGNIQSAEPTGTITYGGKKYQHNDDLKCLLFLGVDKTEEVQVNEYAGRNGQSDCIILLVMNQKEKTTKLVQISRDSMVDLKIYSISGEFMTTMRGQLALQYAYGDGEKKSCRLAEEAVSNLLYGLKIDGYISLNIEGISEVVDTLGGLEFTLSEDAVEVDSSYLKGSVVKLNGEEAEHFVRYRDIHVLGSNNGRMERQVQFLRALFSRVKEAAAENNDVYDTLLDSASPYMVSDLTAEEMKALSEYNMDDAIEKVPGNVQEGEAHDEYIVDDEKLYELIIKTFYKPI